MCNMRSYQTRPYFTWPTRFWSLYWTAQPRTQIQTCESPTPRKWVFFAKWRDASKPLFNKSSSQSMRRILRISATAKKPNQLYCGGCAHSPPRKLRLVGDSGTPQVQGYRQEDNISSSIPDWDLTSAVKELLEFSNTTRTSYTQLQAFNVEYVIIHRTAKFVLVII